PEHSHPNGHISLAFSADSKRLAAGTDAGLNVWELAGGKSLFALRTPAGYVHLAGRAGEIVRATGHQQNVQPPPKLTSWQVATGQQVGQIGLPQMGGFVHTEISPDGRSLALTNVGGAFDNVVWMTDMSTGRSRLLSPGGHSRGVQAQAFRP